MFYSSNTIPHYATPINLKREIAQYNARYAPIVPSFNAKTHKKAFSSFFNPYTFSYNYYGNLRTIDRYTNRDISCETLRRVANKAWLINVCIANVTRKVKPFLKLSTNKNARGFIIHKVGESIEESLKSKSKTQTEEIQGFIQNCGLGKDTNRDPLVRYGVKIIRDLSVLDMASTEVTYNKLGKVNGFYAIDSATIEKVAPNQDNKENIEYVQVIDSIAHTFYPKGSIVVDFMNPRTDISRSTYGYSIVEQAVDLVASQINTFAYNAGFFTENKLPKGMLLLQGNPDQNTVEAFEDYIVDIMSGNPSSQWRIPIIPSGTENGDVKWVSFGSSNREMEFQTWLDFLTSAIVSLFGCSMDELGLQSAKSQAIFEKNSAPYIEASKSLILGDMLSFLQDYLNKILALAYPEYMLEFVGYEKEDQKQVVDIAKTELETFKTVNEVRVEKGLDKLDADWADECPANPQLVQLYNASKAAEEGDGMGGGEEGMPEGVEGEGETAETEGEEDSVDTDAWSKLNGGENDSNNNGDSDNNNSDNDNSKDKEVKKSFSESEHPRGDSGRFIDKGETRTARLKSIARQTELITDIKPLIPTRENARRELARLRDLSKSGGLRCHCLNDKKVIVNEISAHHQKYEAGNIRRIQKDIQERARLLPFIEPILNKTGLVAEKSIKRNGSYGIVGRTIVDNKETAIKIILQESRDGLLYLSVLNMGNIKKSVTTTSVTHATPCEYPEIPFVTQLFAITLNNSVSQGIKKSTTKSIDIW